MSKGFIAKETCSFKVGIYQNRDGNILQPGEKCRHIFIGACGTEVKNHADTFLKTVHTAPIHLQSFLAVGIHGFLQTAYHGLFVLRHSSVDTHRHGDMLGTEDGGHGQTTDELLHFLHALPFRGFGEFTF